MVLALTLAPFKFHHVDTGELRFRGIKMGDWTALIEDLKTRDIDDRYLVERLLARQLEMPKAGLDFFEKMTDKLLVSVAKGFMDGDSTSFRYFKRDRLFFRAFRNALLAEHDHHMDMVAKSVAASGIPSFAAMDGIRRALQSPIQKQLRQINFAQKVAGQLANHIAAQTKAYLREIQASMLPTVNALNTFDIAYKTIAETLTPPLKMWEAWLNANRSALENFDLIRSTLAQRYKITEVEAATILARYKWLITPSLPSEFVFSVVEIGKPNPRTARKVSQLFHEHFSGSDWANLEAMVRGWRGKKISAKRLRIIRDCVVSIQSAPTRLNVANVVLPCLIVQIDGALSDFLDEKQISWDTLYDDHKSKKRAPRLGRKSVLRSHVNKTPAGPMDDLFLTLFLDVLLQHSSRGHPPKNPFGFNRHKIIHGESLSYGRKDHMIRAFLLLDYIAHLN